MLRQAPKAEACGIRISNVSLPMMNFSEKTEAASGERQGNRPPVAGHRKGHGLGDLVEQPAIARDDAENTRRVFLHLLHEDADQPAQPLNAIRRRLGWIGLPPETTERPATDRPGRQLDRHVAAVQPHRPRAEQFVAILRVERGAELTGEFTARIQRRICRAAALEEMEGQAVLPAIADDGFEALVLVVDDRVVGCLEREAVEADHHEDRGIPVQHHVVANEVLPRHVFGQEALASQMLIGISAARLTLL